MLSDTFVFDNVNKYTMTTRSKTILGNPGVTHYVTLHVMNEV